MSALAVQRPRRLVRELGYKERENTRRLELSGLAESNGLRKLR